MRFLVTGSSGHLGEALMRVLRSSTDHEAIGADLNPGAFTDRVGTIVDAGFASRCVKGADVVIHTATLHKPHIATHSRQAFVDTNVTGTLNLLEAAAAEGVQSFIYTSTTSTYGRALVPPPGQPAAWITEDVMPEPKNIYGATKLSAEHLCEMFHHSRRMPCIVLRTSRFFPEEDDDEAKRVQYIDQDNLKVNELLNRRVDIEDVVSAHLLAVERAPELRFDHFIVSATTPFTRDDLPALRTDAATVLRRYAPNYEDLYVRRGWLTPTSLDRVYVNERARKRLGWQPLHDFGRAVERLSAGKDYRSALAVTVGSKGYHDRIFDVGPSSTESTRP